MQIEYEHNLGFNLRICYINIPSLHPFHRVSLHPPNPPLPSQSPSLEFMTFSFINFLIYLWMISDLGFGAFASVNNIKVLIYCFGRHAFCI